MEKELEEVQSKVEQQKAKVQAAKSAVAEARASLNSVEAAIDREVGLAQTPVVPQVLHLSELKDLLVKDFRPKVSPEVANSLDQLLAMGEQAGTGGGAAPKNPLEASDGGSVGGDSTTFGDMELDEDLCQFLGEHVVPKEAEGRAELVKKAGAAIFANKASISTKLKGHLKTKSKFGKSPH